MPRITEVKIIASFTSGSTCLDRAKVEAHAVKLLLDELRKSNVADFPISRNGGLFGVEIVAVESKNV